MHKVFLSLLLGLLLAGCYSFKGITVPLGAKTFNVVDFDNKANEVVPGLSEDFAERLRNKIRSNTALTLEDSPEADIIFSGSIQDYRLESKAPQANEQSAINRLSLRIHVNYDYKKDNQTGWSRTFSQQEEFSADQNLLDVQDQLHDALLTQLVEDVFNAAFAEKW